MTDDAFVPENAINYGAVFQRGGQNCGGEDFALFKCPLCGRIYLLEYEADTIYLDGKDLSKRFAGRVGTFVCIGCGKLVPQGVWAGRKAEARFRVLWEDLRGSDWAWIAE